MDVSKLRAELKGELAEILARSRFADRQKLARDAAVTRLTRAEAIAIAATLHDLLGWMPSVQVETVQQEAATAIAVSATVTGDEKIHVTGLVLIKGDLLTTDFDTMERPDYVLLDDFSGESKPIDSRETLAQAIFDSFTGSYRRRYEFAMTDFALRKKALLSEEQLGELPPLPDFPDFGG